MRGRQASEATGGAGTGALRPRPGINRRRYWQRFLELDPELPNRDFPAWVLIDQPGLAKWLATERCFDDFDVPEDYRVTAELVQAKSSPLVDAGLMDKRQLLQACNPELFNRYLQIFQSDTN